MSKVRSVLFLTRVFADPDKDDALAYLPDECLYLLDDWSLCREGFASDDECVRLVYAELLDCLRELLKRGLAVDHALDCMHRSLEHQIVWV
jgi:hypothetical protein